jgi:hypothetical protein
MNKLFKKIFLLFFLLPASLAASAQNGVKGVNLSAHYGANISHSTSMESIKSTYPYGVEFNYFKHYTDEDSWDLCNCFPKSGLSLSFFDYGNKEVVGYGANVSGFIEPYVRLNRKMMFSLKATLGLAFLSNPYDSVRNPENKAYSTPVSGFVAMGLITHYYLNTRSEIFFNLQYNHVSNGGVKDPNIGLNFPSFNMGYGYYFRSLSFDHFRKKQFSGMLAEQRFEVSAFVSSRTVKNGEKKRFPIYGVDVLYSKQVGKFISLTASSEFYRDEVLQEKLRRIEGFSADQYRAGAMTGIEFLMGRFILNHRLGVYVYDPTHYDNLFFHRHGLSYRFNKKITFGINMKAHRNVANFLDFRMTYKLITNSY